MPRGSSGTSSQAWWGSILLLVAPPREEAASLSGAVAAGTVLADLVGEPETLIVDSTLLEVLHPRQVEHSAGFHGAAWAVWGSFAVYGVKLLHLFSAQLTASRSPTN